MMSIRRFVTAAVFVVAGLAAGMPVASAAPGDAGGPGIQASFIGSNSGGANVRPCASTTCNPALGWLPNGTGVTMLCWTDNQWVYPPNSDYASNRWFRSATPVGTGFIHSSLVEGQTSVGRC